jgi:hypothetical protein
MDTAETWAITICAAATFTLLLTGSGIAQVPEPLPPTETDLHTAYCREVINAEIGTLEDGIAKFPNDEYTAPSADDSDEVRAAKARLAENKRTVRAGLETEKAILRKLDLYLVPRIVRLDPYGILGAQSAAKDDMARVTSAPSNCRNECPASLESNALIRCVTECATRAMPDLASIQKKLRACQNPDWLPF